MHNLRIINPFSIYTVPRNTVMAAGFSDLPNEILLRIIGLLLPGPVADIRATRLLSRKMSDLVSSVLFETIKVDPIEYPSLRNVRAITSELVSGNAPASIFGRYSRKAKVMLSNPFKRREDQLPWLVLLKHITPTLRNLHDLEWEYRPCDQYPPQLVADFINALGSIQSLRNLSLAFETLPPPDDFSLDPLSELVSITIKWEQPERPIRQIVTQISRLLARCPDLEKFVFKLRKEYCYRESLQLGELFASFSLLPENVCLKLRVLRTSGLTVTIHDIRTHLRHLRPLKELEILVDRSPSAPSHFALICKMLKEEGIFVQNFHTDCLHPPEVFDYLSACPGIVHLCLRPGRHQLDDSPMLLDKFFYSVLPHHCHSLRALKLGGPVSTAWTYIGSREQLGEIERCRLLEDLCCWTSTMPQGGSTQTERTEEVLLGWMETATRLPLLRRLRCPPVLSKRFEIFCGMEAHLLRDGERDPDIGLREFVLSAVSRFKLTHNVQFDISVSFHA